MEMPNNQFLKSPSGLFDALWQNYPDNLFLIRVGPAAEFIVEAVNPALQERFAQSRALLEGQTIDEIHPPEEAREIKAHYRECLMARRTIQYEEVSRSPVAEGEVFETILIPIPDDHGDIRHILGISRAITRMRRAEQALKQANQDLEWRLERKQSEVAQLRDQVLRHAARDHLTGCYNRALFMEIGERLLNRNLNHSEQNVMALQLSGIDTLRDSLGQSGLDAMISTCARLIQEHLGDEELFGYEGRGSFIMLLDRGPDEAEKLGEKLRRDIEGLCPRWQERVVSLHARVGCAPVDRAKPVGMEEMLQRAALGLS